MAGETLMKYFYCVWYRWSTIVVGKRLHQHSMIHVHFIRFDRYIVKCTVT